MSPSYYRLQFNKNFTFAKALAILPYLEELGVCGVYASPVFGCVAGSLHGYDVTDPNTFSPEIGTHEEFVAFAKELKKRKMGLILDCVANHMAASLENPWWRDVLAKGEASPYALFFDIDFSRWNGKVLLPILSVPINEAIERGLVTVQSDGILVENLLLPRCDTEEGDVHEILSRQHYRLGFWQEAAQEINYRRFFDITGLAALRIEREEVFDAYHKLIFKLIEEDLVTGVRIDHPDGIYDPKEYLDRLQAAFSHNLYIVVEKILQREESLPDNWPVAGTVGYEFLSDLTSVYVDQNAEAAFNASYAEHDNPGELLYEQKKSYALLYLTSEMRALTRTLQEALARSDISEVELEKAIVALFAAFPVYRTYIGSHDRILTERDQKYIERAFFEAREREPNLRDVFAVLEGVFTVQKPKYLDFLMRFQQLSPPIMAKGLEDTFCYTYNRFVALNEVGGHPLDFGISIDAFHARNTHRAENHPHGLVTVMTHDAKRSHDVRMRLCALSEMPDRFAAMLSEWRLLLDNHGIDSNTEYLFFQTLLGAWPISRERMEEYMLKAAREAKVHTNWVHNNAAYETRLKAFVKNALQEGAPFMQSFLPFAKEVAVLGEKNSIASLTLFLGAPGALDIYQGSEFWDFRLVDPDNRGPVTFAAQHDNPKFIHLQKGLHLRKKYPKLFLDGTYEPIDCGENVIGFMREYKNQRACFFARRFFTRDAPNRLEIPFSGQNVFTGARCENTVDLGEHGTAIVFFQKAR